MESNLNLSSILKTGQVRFKILIYFHYKKPNELSEC